MNRLPQRRIRPRRQALPYRRAAGAAVALAAALPAQAAGLDGAGLAAWWGLPFAGLLLSIAVMPLVAPAFWHRHFGKVAAAWSLAFLLPFAGIAGPGAAAASLLHTLLAEYIPFIVLIGTLYIVAGGIYVRGNLHGSPALNTALLGLGAILASVMGTTGASMLLIRPLLRANDNRVRVTHVVVFFIFIVSNAGGSLTPLGDPPLFLGFLNGVDFFWTLRHLLPETAFLIGTLLAIFYALDRTIYRREGVTRVDPTPDTRGFGFEGRINFALLAGVVGLVLLSGMWKSDVAWRVAGTELRWAGLVRDLGLAAIASASLRLTPPAPRCLNQFGWAPMAEVAKLFAAIFVTIVPVIAMLRAGTDGAFGAVVAAVTGVDGQPISARYFWTTGMLSSFLDNAPTYLVFFNTAGGDAQRLMTTDANTLAAISAGSVFMGANSYIGNAPNLMVKAIAIERGVRMPGFFGYMLWSGGLLIPLFAVMTWWWF